MSKLTNLKIGENLEFDVYDVGTNLLLCTAGTLIDENLHSFLTDREVNIKRRFMYEAVKQKAELSKKERMKAYVEQSYKETEERTAQLLKTVDNGVLTTVEDSYMAVGDIIDLMGTKQEMFKYLNDLNSIDDVTYSHSVKVSLLSNVFGSWLGLKGEELKILTVAGLLHDIGKLRVNPEVLGKPSRLTNDEFNHMRRHPLYGYDVIMDNDLPEEVKFAVIQHHEKIDGSGYPLGLSSLEIRSTSKIIAICDIYEAMTARRPYHEPTCPFQVIKNFEVGHLGKLDTKYLMLFMKNMAYSYLGHFVHLNSGELGEVVFINERKLSAPLVQLESGKCIDLSQDDDNHIIRMVD